MAASGLFTEASEEHAAVSMLRYALVVQDPCHQALLPFALAVRTGVNAGETICGVLGGRVPHFDVWGDSVNTASRLEATSLPGRVHVGPAVHAAAGHVAEFVFRPRPERVHLKGKGVMQTWFVEFADPGALPLPVVNTLVDV